MVQFAEDSVVQQDVAIKFFANSATFKAETSWLHSITLGSVAMAAAAEDEGRAAAEAAEMESIGGGDSMTRVPSNPEMSNHFSNLPAQHWLRLRTQRERRAASVATSGASDRAALQRMPPKVWSDVKHGMETGNRVRSPNSTGFM